MNVSLRAVVSAVDAPPPRAETPERVLAAEAFRSLGDAGSGLSGMRVHG
jgi:hypothetical protein